jgi:hypothetical protein
MEELERRIRDRAYAIWEREGRPKGRDRQHWEQATREIDAERDPARQGEAPSGDPRGTAGEAGAARSAGTPPSDAVGDSARKVVPASGKKAAASASGPTAKKSAAAEAGREAKKPGRSKKDKPKE